MEESTYSSEQIAEMNLLSIFAKERERTNRGIPRQQINTLFRFETPIVVDDLVSNLLKKAYLLESNGEILVSPEGLKRLHNLRLNADKPALEIFARQQPITYQTLSRVNFLEGTISSLTLTLVSLVILLINEFVLWRQLDIEYPFWLYVTITSLVLLIFAPSFVILVVTSFVLIIKGMGLFLKPLSFELWLYIEENAEKIAKVTLLILILIGIVVSYYVAGIAGLIRGLIVGTVFWLISHYRKVTEWTKYFVDRVKK